MIMVLTMVGISGLLMVAGSTIFTALERRTSRDAQRVVEQKIVDEIGLFISSKTSCEVILAPAKNIPAFTNAVTYTDQTTYQDFIDFGAGGSPNPPDILTGLPNGKNFPESASTRLYDGLLVESIKLMNHHVLPSGNRSLTLGVNFRRKGTGGALPVISPYYKLYVFASVDGSGNIYRSTSALKYKQDVRDLESIDISSFRPVRYKSKSPKDDPNKDFIGFIADEFHDAGLTELVSYGNDSDGKPTVVEGFNYDRLTVILTKALQEANAKIATLEAKVKALEEA